MKHLLLLVPMLVMATFASQSVGAVLTNSFPKYERPVMTWVPPYAVSRSKARLLESFDGVGMKSALTHLGLQFWLPTKDGGIARAGRTNETGDSAIAELRDWGRTNGVRVLLCVYNAMGGKWDWPLARAGFAENPQKFTDALMAEVNRLQLDGVDIDLEGNGPFDADKTAFADFIRKLSVRLHAEGRHLTADTFSYKWNAPNQTWWKELFPHVDGLTTMGYEELGASAAAWRSYASQKAAAGQHASKLMIGLPSGRNEWRGNSAMEQLQWLKTDGGVGVSFWDAQIRAEAWQKPEVWKILGEIRGGPRATSQTTRPLMRNFIGINGHTVQFKPELYQPVCRLVRDYHPVQWDLGTNTAEAAPFPFAKNRVDWNQVYGSWRKKDFTIDASLMFESIKQTNWADVQADAMVYGRAFAREFGPSGKRQLVEAVEIGNEPGNWDDAAYTQMFRAMASGIREGDPKMKIATCNLTTGKSGKYEKSVDCVAKFPQLFDVLNVHTYAQLENWPTWRRSFPEDPKLPKYLQDVEALCHWRDANAPDKPIWITEFGYDSSTKPAANSGDAAKWVGVTDEQQAQWLVRSLLVFSAMPVERAYIYFFNDEDKPSLHASAGITRHFQPKPSFHALAHLQRVLGEYRFTNVVTNEPGRLRVQEYQHGSDEKKFVWIVWSPTGENRTADETLQKIPGRLTDVQRMPLSAAEETTAKEAVVMNADLSCVVKISERPLYLFFVKP